MPSKNLLQTEICSREAHIYDCKCVQGLLIDQSYCTSGAAKLTSGKATERGWATLDLAER